MLPIGRNRSRLCIQCFDGMTSLCRIHLRQKLTASADDSRNGKFVRNQGKFLSWRTVAVVWPWEGWTSPAIIIRRLTVESLSAASNSLWILTTNLYQSISKSLCLFFKSAITACLFVSWVNLMFVIIDLKSNDNQDKLEKVRTIKRRVLKELGNSGQCLCLQCVFGYSYVPF